MTSVTKQLNKEQSEKKEEKLLNKKDIFVILVAILSVVLIRIFIMDTALVRGASMESTIFDGEKVSFYKLGEPEKGDIVIVKLEEQTLIKRLIATEGDSIEIKDGVVYLNDKILEEGYIKEEMEDQNLEKITLKEDELFIMGDNRNRSTDSRYFGVFSLKENYRGKVFLRYKFFDTFQIIK